MRKLLTVLTVLASTMSIPSIAATSGSMFAGPKADIAGVTAAAHTVDPKAQVGGAHVAGDYALLQLYFPPYASGVAIFKRTSGEQWKKLTWGGGALGGSPTSFGVPVLISTELCSGWPPGRSAC